MRSIRNRFRNAYYRARGHYPVVLNGAHFKVDPYHINFWREAASARWEPRTFPILRRFTSPETLYCDIGAWIGPTVIYAARRCRKVICFEPDPMAYRYLRWNIELNGLANVSSFSVALSDRIAVQAMASFSGELGDSATSLLADRHKGVAGPSVDALTIDWRTFSTAANPGRIDFMKMDIEGGEFAFLPQLESYLAEHKPVLFLSTHAPFLPEDRRAAAMASLARIVSVYKTCLDESLRAVDPASLTTADAANRFRSYIFTA